MRLWSLHPSYLDSKGLVALWREALLARHVLNGQTRGYTKHPQLLRFRQSNDPLKAIDTYLQAVYREALERNFTFDQKKIGTTDTGIQLSVSQGQMDYEYAHLLRKLAQRDAEKYRILKKTVVILPHPMFTVVPGDRESWEIVK